MLTKSVAKGAAAQLSLHEGGYYGVHAEVLDTIAERVIPALDRAEPWHVDSERYFEDFKLKMVADLMNYCYQRGIRKGQEQAVERLENVIFKGRK